jgi:hypothetical protein
MNTKAKLHQAKLTKWAALIKEQSESNLTVREWCKQNNITIHAYNYWKHLLKEEAVKSMMPDIVPLPAVPPSSLPSVVPALAEPVVIPPIESRDSRNTITVPTPVAISLGDVHIEIGSSASDDFIANIIKAVRHA